MAFYTAINKPEQYKIEFQGQILSVQPRSNVWRYRLDNRTHSLTGFNLFLRGTAEGEDREFSVAISGLQQEKHQFRIGDTVEGTAWTKKYPKWEYADYYRAGSLKRLVSADETLARKSPPWTDLTPKLDIYEWRGCRMLDARRWRGKCFTCKWAAMANVTIEYNWGVSQKYRFESFCYGPKSCKLYAMGRPRPVPYKDCGVDYDQGWLDEICTERRDEDD